MYYEGIKNIELVLENCEVITIPREFILDVTFSNYKRTFQRVACNSINTFEIYEDVFIEIDGAICDSKEAQEKLFQEVEDFHLFLKSRTDITGIYVNYEDKYSDKNFHFHPVWTGESDYENEATSMSENSSGDLLLVISKNTDPEFTEMVKEFKENWDDKESQQFKKDMYSIKD